MGELKNGEKKTRNVKKKIHIEARFFMHAQSSNGGINLNQILHIDFLGGRSDIYETASKLVQGFEMGRPAGVRNFAYPIDFWATVCKTVCKDDTGYITQLKQQKSKR